MKETEKKKASRQDESRRQAQGRAKHARQQPAPNTAEESRRIRDRARPGQRGKVRILIPAAQQDNAALLKAGREWLIPLLVRDFLRERGLEPTSGTDPSKYQRRSYGTPWQGARATTRELN